MADELEARSQDYVASLTAKFASMSRPILDERLADAWRTSKVPPGDWRSLYEGHHAAYRRAMGIKRLLKDTGGCSRCCRIQDALPEAG